jgi:hypothetical protein
MSGYLCLSSLPFGVIAGRSNARAFFKSASVRDFGLPPRRSPARRFKSCIDALCNISARTQQARRRYETSAFRSASVDVSVSEYNSTPRSLSKAVVSSSFRMGRASLSNFKQSRHPDLRPRHQPESPDCRTLSSATPNPFWMGSKSRPPGRLPAPRGSGFPVRAGEQAGAWIGITSLRLTQTSGRRKAL